MSSFVDGSAYVRYQAQMDRIQADAGLFLDFGSLLTRSGGMEVLQPRVNLSYSLWDTWKAKVAYGRFTQSMITVNNEDDVISTGGLSDLSNLLQHSLRVVFNGLEALDIHRMDRA